MFAGLSRTAATVEFRIVEADRQLECRRRTIIGRRDVDIHHAAPAIGLTGIADAAEHALDDVDVMLPAIKVAHAG